MKGLKVLIFLLSLSPTSSMAQAVPSPITLMQSTLALGLQQIESVFLEKKLGFQVLACQYKTKKNHRGLLPCLWRHMLQLSLNPKEASDIYVTAKFLNAGEQTPPTRLRIHWAPSYVIHPLSTGNIGLTLGVLAAQAVNVWQRRTDGQLVISSIDGGVPLKWLVPQAGQFALDLEFDRVVMDIRPYLKGEEMGGACERFKTMTPIDERLCIRFSIYEKSMNDASFYGAAALAWRISDDQRQEAEERRDEIMQGIEESIQRGEYYGRIPSRYEIPITLEEDMIVSFSLNPKSGTEVFNESH